MFGALHLVRAVSFTCPDQHVFEKYIPMIMLLISDPLSEMATMSLRHHVRVDNVNRMLCRYTKVTPFSAIAQNNVIGNEFEWDN